MPIQYCLSVCDSAWLLVQPIHCWCGPLQDWNTVDTLSTLGTDQLISGVHEVTNHGINKYQSATYSQGHSSSLSIISFHMAHHAVCYKQPSSKTLQQQRLKIILDKILCNFFPQVRPSPTFLLRVHTVHSSPLNCHQRFQHLIWYVQQLPVC